MNYSLEKIDKNTWFTNDRKFAIIKAFGRKKFWIGKLSINPSPKTLWEANRYIEKTFNNWREARTYLIHNIYKKEEK